MFTIDQLKEAHSKVKSGADFPKYVQEIIALGVTHYNTYVLDGHTVYFGNNDYNVTSPTKYPALAIASEGEVENFKQHLKDHQQGKSDYFTFSKQAAERGVEKWIVDMRKMTCTYYDKKGNEMLVEKVPSL